MSQKAHKCCGQSATRAVSIMPVVRKKPVRMAAFFMEDLYEDFIKISFRSKDEVDVNQFSRKYFNGGGHINAAGGKSLESLPGTIETFKSRIAEENL